IGESVPSVISRGYYGRMLFRPPARITRPARGECKYVRQTAGRGYYGHVRIYIYPRSPGSGFLFQNEITGGAIPVEFIHPIEEGLRYAAKLGRPEGNEIADVRVVLDDGSYHDVDSDAIAFRTAAQIAFHKAVQMAGAISDAEGDGESYVTELRRPPPTP